MARLSVTAAALLLSVLSVVRSQPASYGWNHAPPPQQMYQPPQQYRPPPPQPPGQPPRHWQYQPQAHHQAAAGAGAAAAAVTTAAPTPPVEVEPLEIEGPTTTALPITPPAPAYNYGHGALHGPGHGHATVHVHNQPAPQNPFGWGQVRAQAPPQPKPQQPPQPQVPQQPQSWGAQRVMPQQAPTGTVKTQAVQVQPTHGYPQQQPQQQYGGYYQQQPQQSHTYVQPNVQQPAQGQGQQPAQGHLPAALDPFNQYFNEQAFARAYMLAKTTTPPPMPMGVQQQQGWGGQGQQQVPGQDWAGSFGSAFVMTSAPTTPAPPPPTTPDHMVKINPYRLGGFYVGPNPAVAPKRVLPPEPVVIEIPSNSVTSNPFDAFMGETHPPATKPTTALPGRNGDFAAGWLGFHEQQTTQSSKALNSIGDQQFAAFFPVPMDNPQHNAASGPGVGPGGWDMGPPQQQNNLPAGQGGWYQQGPPQLPQGPPPPQQQPPQQVNTQQVESILTSLLSSLGSLTGRRR